MNYDDCYDGSVLSRSLYDGDVVAVVDPGFDWDYEEVYVGCLSVDYLHGD